jgi:hypothetical protein
MMDYDNIKNIEPLRRAPCYNYDQNEFYPYNNEKTKHF